MQRQQEQQQQGPVDVVSSHSNRFVAAKQRVQYICSCGSTRAQRLGDLRCLLCRPTLAMAAASSASTGASEPGGPLRICLPTFNFRLATATFNLEDVAALALDGHFYNWQQFQDHYGAEAEAYWLAAEDYCAGRSIPTARWLQPIHDRAITGASGRQHAGSSSGQQLQASDSSVQQPQASDVSVQPQQASDSSSAQQQQASESSGQQQAAVATETQLKRVGRLMREQREDERSDSDLGPRRSAMWPVWGSSETSDNQSTTSSSDYQRVDERSDYQSGRWRMTR